MLKDEAEEYTKLYISKLEKEYPEIKDYQRILDTYSIMQAGFKQWISQHPWSINIDFEDSITKYIVKRVLPWHNEETCTGKRKGTKEKQHSDVL
jgi:hypothetical protein